MGIFGKKIDTEPLLDRIRKLELQCEDLERGRKSLDLEFTELYDKVSHQMSRMSKRYAAANKDNGEEPPTSPGNSHLDSLDPISRSIMIRRARGAQPK